jgi:hypothetical protein
MRKVMDRLGCGEEGAEEIKSHPFNFSLDWAMVLRKEYVPEFVPEGPRGEAPRGEACEEGPRGEAGVAGN